MPTFCRLPCDSAPIRVVEVESVGQLAHPGGVDATAQPAEEAQVLLAGQVRVPDELARQVPDTSLHLFAPARHVHSEQLGSTG